MQSTVSILESRTRSVPRLMGALLLGLTVAMGPAHFAHARGAPESFADLAEKISPAVVNITTSAVISLTYRGGMHLDQGFSRGRGPAVHGSSRVPQTQSTNPRKDGRS